MLDNLVSGSLMPQHIQHSCLLWMITGTQCEPRHTPFPRTPFCWHTVLKSILALFKELKTLFCTVHVWSLKSAQGDIQLLYPRIKTALSGEVKRCVWSVSHPFSTWNSPLLTSPSHLCAPNPGGCLLHLHYHTDPGSSDSLQVPHRHKQGGKQKENPFVV